MGILKNIFISRMVERIRRIEDDPISLRFP